MTTIAARRGFLAADSGIICNGVYAGNTTKLYEFPDKIGHFGMTGALSEIRLVVAWLYEDAEHCRRFKACQRPQDPPKFDDGVQGLFILPGFQTFAFNVDLIPWFVDADFTAVGSGMQLALGAMEMGATAVEAVEVACRRDPASVRPVVYRQLLTPVA